MFKDSPFACLQVHIVKDRRMVKLQVNGEIPMAESIDKRLDVNASIFVGGFPKEFTPASGLVCPNT